MSLNNIKFAIEQESSTSMYSTFSNAQRLIILQKMQLFVTFFKLACLRCECVYASVFADLGDTCSSKRWLVTGSAQKQHLSETHIFSWKDKVSKPVADDRSGSHPSHPVLCEHQDTVCSSICFPPLCKHRPLKCTLPYNSVFWSCQRHHCQSYQADL